LLFGPNQKGKEPWRLIAGGSKVVSADFPDAPVIPSPPPFEKGSEIIIRHDHILDQNSERVSFLANTPPVAQMCAVVGAVQWSMNRGLHFPYWYFGKTNYLVPLYLQNREDITKAPDLVAPVQVGKGTLLVRTVLDPHMPYANARVAVGRHDQLPHWLLDGWKEYSKMATTAELENLEGPLSGEEDGAQSH
jgi:hypothetical protein